MLEITGKTRQLALLGNPVSHSLSPQIHNYISDRLGLDYIYTAMPVDKHNFKSAIEGVRALNFAGVNVTSPYKIDAYNLVDVLSEEAKLYGSVNTVVNQNGVLYGYSTDAEGFYKSLLREGSDVLGKDVLFIGAGGVTKPVMVHFARLGAKSISIINRTKEKALDIADYVNEVCGFQVQVGITKKHYDVVINTTTVGMHPNVDKCPVEDMSYVDESTTVCDMIYNPEKTLFLKMAEKKGAKIMNGLGMLIYQGLLAYELFTGVKLDYDIYDEILENVFAKQVKK